MLARGVSYDCCGLRNSPTLRFEMAGSVVSTAAALINLLCTIPFLPRVSGLEVCMGMGKTGIPWVPWNSHGNGSKISHGMGMGWERELSAWEWELRCGNWKKSCIL